MTKIVSMRFPVSLDESHCMTDKQTLPAQPAVQLVVNYLNDTALVVSALNTNFKEKKFNCLYSCVHLELGWDGPDLSRYQCEWWCSFRRAAEQNRFGKKERQEKEQKKSQCPKIFLVAKSAFWHTPSIRITRVGLVCLSTSP